MCTFVYARSERVNTRQKIVDNLSNMFYNQIKILTNSVSELKELRLKYNNHNFTLKLPLTHIKFKVYILKHPRNHNEVSILK